VISTAGSRDSVTSRLKSSLSTSPRKMCANASSNTGCSASTSISVSVAAAVSPRSWIQIGARPSGAMRYGHRQAVRQHDGSALPEGLEAKRVRRRFERPVERHADRLGRGQAVHHLDVGNRGAPGEVLAVPGRKRCAEVVEERIAARLARRLDQRLA
jgi:hypothetical protein